MNSAADADDHHGHRLNPTQALVPAPAACAAAITITITAAMAVITIACLSIAEANSANQL